MTPRALYLMNRAEVLSFTMSRLSSNILAFRIAIAAQEGDDVDSILHASGAPFGLMRGAPPYVDLQTERNVWTAIVEATGRDDIGLVCGQPFPTQANGILGYVMANAPTIRIAVEKCCTYQRVLGDSMGMVCERGPDTTRISIAQWSPWHDTLRYTVDTFMAAILSWSNANAPAPLQPLQRGLYA